MQLAFDDQWIDDGAEVVHRGVFHDLDDTGLGIELDLAHMAAVGEGGSARPVAHVAHIKCGWRISRQSDSATQLLGQLHDADRTVSASDDKPSFAELYVARGGFEDVRGNLLALLDHLAGGFDNGGAAVHDRFGAASAAAGEQLVAVALHKTNPLERDAELLGQHLRERS